MAGRHSGSEHVAADVARIRRLAFACLLALGTGACIEKEGTTSDTRIEEGDDLCTRFCNKVEGADCSFFDDCRIDCKSWLASSCKEEWTTWFECGLDAPLVCSAEGSPEFGGCNDEFRDVFDCVEAASQQECGDWGNVPDCGACCGERDLEVSDIFYGYTYECTCEVCAEDCADFCDTGNPLGVTNECVACVWETGYEAGCTGPALLECSMNVECAEMSTCYERACKEFE